MKNGMRDRMGVFVAAASPPSVEVTGTPATADVTLGGVQIGL